MSTPEATIVEVGEPAPIPDTYVPVSTTGALFIDAMAPWITEHLAWFLDACGSMFDQVTTVAYDQGVDGNPDYIPGYGVLLDPMLCPTGDLPYLGQFVGVTVPNGATPTAALSAVTAESGLNRGTLSSIQAAVIANISTAWAASTAYTAGQIVSYGNPLAYYLVTTGFTSGSTFSTTDLSLLSSTQLLAEFSITERENTAGAADAYWITIRVNPSQLTPASNTTAILAAIDAVKPGGVLINLIATNSPEWSAATLEWHSVASTVTWNSVSTGQV